MQSKPAVYAAGFFAACRSIHRYTLWQTPADGEDTQMTTPTLSGPVRIIYWLVFLLLCAELVFALAWEVFYWRTMLLSDETRMFGMLGSQVFRPLGAPPSWLLHSAVIALIITVRLFLLRRRAVLISLSAAAILHLVLWLTRLQSDYYQGGHGYALIIVHAILILAIVALIQKKMLR
jgi:hypothetical protein